MKEWGQDEIKEHQESSSPRSEESLKTTFSSCPRSQIVHFTWVIQPQNKGASAEKNEDYILPIRLRS